MIRLILLLSLLPFAACDFSEGIPCLDDENCPTEKPFCVPGNVCSENDIFTQRDAGPSDVQSEDEN